MISVPRVHASLQVLLFCLRPFKAGRVDNLRGSDIGEVFEDIRFTTIDGVSKLLGHGEVVAFVPEGITPYMRLRTSLDLRAGVIAHAANFYPPDLLSRYSDRHIDMPYHKLGPAAKMVRRFKIGDIDEKCSAEDMGLPSGLKVDVRNKLHLRAPKPSEEILRALPRWALHQSHPLYEVWEYVQFMNILRTYVELYREYELWDDLMFETCQTGAPRPVPVFSYTTRMPGRYDQESKDPNSVLKLRSLLQLHKIPADQNIAAHTDVICGEQQALEVLETLEAELEDRWSRIVKIIKIWGKWSLIRNAILFSKKVQFNKAEKKVLLSGRLVDNLNGINILNSAQIRFLLICENEVKQTMEAMNEEWLHVVNYRSKLEKDYVERKMLHWEYKAAIRKIELELGTAYKYYHTVNPLFDFHGALKTLERDAAASGEGMHTQWWNWFLECLQVITKKPVVKKAGGGGRAITRRSLTAEDKLEVEKILKRPRGKGAGSYTYKVIWYDAGKCSDKEWLLRTGGAVHGVEVDAGDWVMRAVPGMKESARKELTKAGFVLGNVWKRRGGQWVKVAWLVRRRV